MKHYYINHSNQKVIIEHPLLDDAWQAFIKSGESTLDDCGIYDMDYCRVMSEIAGNDLCVFGEVVVEETA
jgi:hypothetical protein